MMDGSGTEPNTPALPSVMMLHATMTSGTLAAAATNNTGGAVSGLIVLALLFGPLGYWIAIRSRRRSGTTPWRLPPALWGLLCAAFNVWGLGLEMIAQYTTRPAGAGTPRAGISSHADSDGYEGRRAGPFGLRAAPRASVPLDQLPGGATVVPESGESEPKTVVPGPNGWVRAPRSTTPERPPLFGWYGDPSERHEQRYWDGRDWTDHVRDAGTPSDDAFNDGDIRRLAVDL